MARQSYATDWTAQIESLCKADDKSRFQNSQSDEGPNPLLHALAIPCGTNIRAILTAVYMSATVQGAILGTIRPKAWFNAPYQEVLAA